LKSARLLAFFVFFFFISSFHISSSIKPGIPERDRERERREREKIGIPRSYTLVMSICPKKLGARWNK